VVKIIGAVAVVSRRRSAAKTAPNENDAVVASGVVATVVVIGDVVVAVAVAIGVFGAVAVVVA